MRIIGRAVFVFALSFSSITVANASGGLYMGAGWHSSSVSGRFDGAQVFSNSVEVIVVPEIDSSSGFSLFGGVHMDERWDLEMSYYSSKHNGDWAGIPFDVEYTSLNFDAKVNIRIESEKLIPYVLIGYGFGTITVIDGSSDGFSFGDAKYYGSGLNFGVGANYFIEPNFSIGGAFIKRMTSYDEAEGISGERGELPSDLNGSATVMTVNLIYHVGQ